MIRKYFLFFGLIGLFCKCAKKEETNELVKVEQVLAENIYDLIGSSKLQIYSDSTYDFTVIENSPNHEKIDKYKGRCFIKNDTVFFEPFDFQYTNSTKAILKNNFIEFIQGDFPYKIKIKKSSIEIKQTIDFGKFDSYSLFTYDNKFYSYFTKNAKPYELTQNDLTNVDKILEKCFEENKAVLRNKSNQYTKQVIAVVKSKNEVEVWVNCNCKDKFFKNQFEQQIIQAKDGGNCHFKLKINLSKQSYSAFSVNGNA